MKNFQENIQLMVFINEFIGQEQRTAKKQPFTICEKAVRKSFANFQGNVYAAACFKRLNRILTKYLEKKL